MHIHRYRGTHEKKVVYMERFKLQKGFTKNDILKYKIGTHNSNGRKRTKESAFSDVVEKSLPEIFEDLKKPIESISREFPLQKGRADFLVKHKDGTFTIIEVKYSVDNSQDEAKLNYSVGQLLFYKNNLSREYDIDKNKINLMILNNKEFLSVVDNVLFNDLKIDYLVFGKDGVKFYGIE